MADNNKDCELHQLQRNKYFYGKLMTVKDFEDEQSYMNEKRHLLNRLIHSSGIVCGFDLGKVSISPATGGEAEITFTKGGMALDCCGREIVVPDGSVKKIIKENGTTLMASEITSTMYLYLRYKACYDQLVPAASNPSSCEEKCCPGRVVEDFEVVAITDTPDTTPIVCPDFSEDTNTTEARVTLKKWVKESTKTCPTCDDTKVFFAVINSDLSVNTEETGDHIHFVYNNKLLYELLTCHISDFSNPHKTTAADVGALVSVDGVSNAGGNVDLIRNNSITITPNDGANNITIGETHSARTDNPHSVTADQVGAGQPAINDPSSVRLTKDIGSSTRYAREDHIHDLTDGVVEFRKLTITLQNQLNIVFMYLRERALKCTVVSFKEAGNRFDNNTAFELSRQAKRAVDNKDYEKEEIFIATMKRIFELQRSFAEEIKNLATEDSWSFFDKVLTELGNAFRLASPDALKVATLQDEVCFYALQLETGRPGPTITVRPPTLTLPTFTVTVPTITRPTVTVPSPTVTVPTLTVTIPTITRPTVTLPTLTVTVPTLTVTAPTTTRPVPPTPTVTLPTLTVTVPTITRPTVTVPSPTVTLPTFTTTVPTITAPTVTVPTLTVTVPTITRPTVTVPLPTVTLPTLTATVPTISRPTVTVPSPTVTLPTLTVTVPIITRPTVITPRGPIE